LLANIVALCGMYGHEIPAGFSMTTSPATPESEESIFYPVKCVCGHAEGEHEDGRRTACKVRDCTCESYAPREDMA